MVQEEIGKQEDGVGGSHKRGLALGTSPFPQWQNVLVAVYRLVSPGHPSSCIAWSRFGECLHRGPLLSSRTEAARPERTGRTDRAHHC